VVSAELGMSHAQGGMLETAYLVGYLTIKLPAGVIANRIGIKRTLVLGMIGYALSTALNFFASAFVHLFALRANTLLSERFGDRQGRAIGFHESGPNVGNSIAYPLTVVIASAWGWRHAFLLLSLPAFILAGATTLILKEEKGPGPERVVSGIGGEGTGLRGFLRVLPRSQAVSSPRRSAGGVPSAGRRPSAAFSSFL